MEDTNGKNVLVVGAGLAGCEAAWFLANAGLRVVLVEAKKTTPNPAQRLATYAELVCSNSLKSQKLETGHGLLKAEMSDLHSLLLKVAFETRVPAGDALAVNREEFSERVTHYLANHSGISLLDEEVLNPIDFAEKHNCSHIIMATGPLTTSSLEQWIKDNLGAEDFYFYDAIAPIVDADSLDFSKLYYKDRYKKISDDSSESHDYLNAPFSRLEYEKFIDELVRATKVPARNFEQWKFFEGCLPIDLLAERGIDTPRFGPMKPVGLENGDDAGPYAVVQLRRENLLGDAFNIVGFQTRLTFSEQKRVFRMIPGLENAVFVHYGSVHRNSYLHARKLLNPDLSSKKYSHLYFAGQITGVEGYMESASSGLYVASQLLRKIQGKDFVSWPVETAMGALVNYLMTSDTPRPNNIHFGLFPPVNVGNKKRINRQKYKNIKKELCVERARTIFSSFLKEIVLF